MAQVTEFRVLLADDHLPSRAGTRMSLEEDEDFVIVGEASRGDEAIEMAEELQPDVCVVDVNMPGGRGPEVVKGILARVPNVACVMLTASRDDEDLFACLRAGAIGYLLKDTDPDRLAAALRGALQGEAALPRILVTRLVDEFRDRPQRRVAIPGRKAVDLSEREVIVLRGLRDNQSTKEIAAELGIAPVTVRTYVHTLLKKLRVPDRESAVRLFEEAGE